MKLVSILLLLASLLPATTGAVELADYLPSAAGPALSGYDPAVPTPRSALGFEVGEWHVRPGQQLRYLRALAESSDRVEVEIQGETHELRPQPLAIITAPENHRRLEELRRAHLAALDPTRPAPTAAELDELPVFVLLGYSIHGNEASGANAALLVAYHLAAGQGPEIEQLLSDVVLLLDPSLNPDGLGRFATWANMHRGRVPAGDPAHREHNEVWPGGRTNHYWFDLNRDWLLLVHPESRARVATYHRFKPQLLGDYHEMGSNSTYFFQPGVPSRQNPLTPAANFELTRRLAGFHAAALDTAGRTYYTQESFDDFYPGKGSTYPDLNGSVGVLFEQASVRGHKMETVNGTRIFADAVGNQLLTSLSMLTGAQALAGELSAYQADFFRSALTEAAADPVGAYLFAVPGDPVRAHHLLDLLARHRIEVYRVAREVSAGGETFAAGESYLVPTAQPQYRLVKSLFERRTEFADSAFYDVSTWTLPLAFGAVSAELARGDNRPELAGEAVGEPAFPVAAPPADPAPYAYLFDWGPHAAPRALYRLLAAGFRARVAGEPFEADTDRGRRRFDYGAVVVPLGIQEDRDEELAELVAEIAREDGIEVVTVTTGLTPSGINLGSPNLHSLELPRPLLVVGPGTSGYGAGEIWHLLDRRFGIELPLIDRRQLEGLDLAEYTHVILADGGYGSLAEGTVEALGDWVRGGGTLVAIEGAAGWVERTLLGGGQDDEQGGGPPPPASGPPAGQGEQEDPPPRRRYADFMSERVAEFVSGSIFAVELDPTHPIAWGYGEELAVFRSSTMVLEPSANPYENVALYAADPLLSGYLSERQRERIAGSAAVKARRLGGGTVVQLADDPDFRGVWFGTHKLLANALFFGPVVRFTSAPENW